MPVDACSLNSPLMVRETGRELDDLLAAVDLAERVREDLAVLGGDDLREFALAGFEQLAEREDDRLALCERQRAPRMERRASRGDGGVDLGLVGQGDRAVWSPERRVIDRSVRPLADGDSAPSIQWEMSGCSAVAGESTDASGGVSHDDPFWMRGSGYRSATVH